MSGRHYIQWFVPPSTGWTRAIELSHASQMFTCPICKAYNYRRIVVQTTRGPYETKFYECTGCSVMFLDPQTFSIGRTPKVTLLATSRKQTHED